MARQETDKHLEFSDRWGIRCCRLKAGLHHGHTPIEDDPVFNAGCGSVFNKNDKVEMDAAMIDERHFSAGAVAINSDVLDIILYCDFSTNEEKKSKIRNLAKVAVNHYNP